MNFKKKAGDISQKIKESREEGLGLNEEEPTREALMEEALSGDLSWEEKESIRKSSLKGVERTMIREIIPAWWEFLKTLFGHQKDNELLRDLNVKKGFWAGLAYFIWMTFVLPARVLTFLFLPRWAYVHFVQKYLVSPIFEADFISGSETPSKLMGDVYQKYLHYFADAEKSGISVSTLKPNSAVLERVMTFARVRSIVTLFIFGMIAQFLYEYVSVLGDMVGWVVMIFGTLFGSLFGHDSIIAGFFTGLWGARITWALSAILFSYLGMVFISFFVLGVKAVMYGDKAMVMRFVDDSIHYTVTKSKELYGEDVALKAYELLLENLVLSRRYESTEEPHYVALEKRKLEETA